jgi:mevalonate kinase
VLAVLTTRTTFSPGGSHEDCIMSKYFKILEKWHCILIQSSALVFFEGKVELLSSLMAVLQSVFKHFDILTQNLEYLLNKPRDRNKRHYSETIF